MWIGSSQNPNLYMFRKLLKEEKGDNRSDWANNKFPFSIWDYLMMKFERIQLGCNWAIWRRTFRNLSTLTAKSIVTYNSSNLVNNNMNGLVICWNTSTWNMSTMICKWHFEEKRTEWQCESKATFFLSPTVFEFPTYSNGTLWMCFFLKSWNLLNIITKKYWTGLFLRNYQHAIPFSILGNSLNYPWILFFSPSLNNADG